MKLYTKTAAELGRLLREKACSSEEITRSVFARIHQVEDKVGSYITLTEEQALEQARKADKLLAAGKATSPLTGIPMGIKDNICTKEVPTTCASKMLENYAPPYNATVMDKLEAAGAVMLGKLNMDEFAMGSSTETSYFKKTANPHDLTRIPGGSSGGSASALAAGEAILTLGSDTGGSVRLPASFCGVVGLKPTYGAVSRFGLVAFASSLDQIGQLGRSVEDVAMLFGAVCGADTMDATSARREYPDFAALLNHDISGKTIGLPGEYFGDGVDAEVCDAVMAGVKLLEQAGAKVVNLSLPSTKYALSAYYILSSAEASSNLARFDGVRYGYRTKDYADLNEMYEKTRSEGFGEEVQRRIMLGTHVLSSGYYDAYYNRAKRLQLRVAAEYAAAFEQCDCLVTPTSPFTAFRMGENIGDPLKMYAADVCTVTVNIVGLPALSVPCGKSKAGLPMGMQLIGPKFSEQNLLNMAYCYERLCGGFDCLAHNL